MTFEEFLQKTYNYLKANDCWVTEAYQDPKSHESLDKPQYYGTGDTFYASWTLGGTQGWYGQGDEGPSVVDGEPEPENPKELDLILECLCPHLSFLQYKGIVREVLKRETKHHSDYYGGATTEGHKGFKVKELYEALQKRDLIQARLQAISNHVFADVK